MGYSCTRDASNMLGVIGRMFATNQNPNILTIKGREYFFERGREQADGAITGTLMLDTQDGHCRKAGSVRIEPDGSISKFPALSKDERIEAINTLRDMEARNPQLLQYAAGGGDMAETAQQTMPKSGFRFTHARVLSTEKFDGKTLQRYQVTKVAGGTIWFAPVYDEGIEGSERLGKSDKCACDYFYKIVAGEQ